MIKVTVELLPFGDESKKKHLGIAYISNDGSGQENLGNYKVTLSKMGKPNETWKLGTVIDFPRKKLGGWDLLYRALQDVVGDRNDKERKNVLE